MGGEPDTVGGIELYYVSLNGYALNSIHVENLLDLFWVSSLADNFIFLRNYTNLVSHNSVSIWMEMIVL